MRPVFLRDLETEQSLLLASEIFNMGSDPGCNLHVFGEKVSARHARIEKKENLYYIRDLRSTEGTFVNEAKVLEAQLSDGDIIRVGNKEFRFLVQADECDVFPITSRNAEWNQELKSLNHVAKTDHPVLLLGPSGTGKDVLAKALHEKSYRFHGPFVSVNCSALTETLVESELFGHVKGSFTGAISDRKGAFESARGGTLFLDEIGDLPYGLQAKILRALENNEIRPVGSDKVFKTDVRIIAATHQHLPERIGDGTFRMDLFYRLNVVNVLAPALRDRMEDFDSLLMHFAKEARVRFSFGAILKLKSHSWPGNIRELKNLVSRASAKFPRESIEESHLTLLMDRLDFGPRGGSQVSAIHSCATETLPVIKEIEKQMIIKRLSANRGNQRRTALDLGMPKSTLHDRIRTYQIDPENFR